MVNSMRSVKMTLVFVVLGVILLPLLTLLIPLPPEFTSQPEVYYQTLIGTSLFCLLYDAAAILFVRGLKTFKPQLRQAYGLICWGLVLIGLNSLQYPIAGIFNLWSTHWFTQGIADVPYLIGGVLVFLGIKRFADIIQVKTPLLSTRIMAVVTVLVAIGAFIAVRILGREESAYDMHLTLTTSSIIPFMLAAYGLLAIKRTAGPAYTSSLAWFFLGLLCTAVGGALVVIYDFGGITKDIVLIIPEILAGVLLIKAAYAFNKIGLY